MTLKLYLDSHSGVARPMQHLLHDAVRAAAKVADLHQIIRVHREGLISHRNGGLLVQIPWSCPKIG